ncbi:hypothetical protein [Lactococcus protaetiae]|uniref:hypothetical protein n=1 Tax=Lactococcus protaetiae TaxID=2592653 RepID=UPI001680BA41|nr:hypothetical protein [Lactococcus protaetiae]
MMTNKSKHDIINDFEQENYKLSQFLKQQMIEQLSCTQIIMKLADMADMPGITRY